MIPGASKIPPDFIPPRLRQIIAENPVLARCYLVGGGVRDALLGHAVKDYDIEVYGVSYEAMAEGLARHGKTNLVGRSFGVLKLTIPGGEEYDFAVPRRDSKIGIGHKGFEVHFDPSITPVEAAARRDYTINALMLDLRTGELLDYFGGQHDLQQRVLRHTSPAFVEDPLRVLRGMQFAGRFGLSAAPETIELCKSIKALHGELPRDRVREEWFKWAAKSTVPSAGLRFLASTEWIDHYPELQNLMGTPQDAEWHPEGDVFTHTCHCCDALVHMPEWQRLEDVGRIIYMLAVLAHDFGKPATTSTVTRQGRERVVSPGHEEAGVVLAEQFLDRIGAPQTMRPHIGPLVANHLAHINPITDRMVRRLAAKLQPETIEGLALLMKADHAGRPPRTQDAPSSVMALVERAHALSVRVKPPTALLMGRHLIEVGLTPGPSFSEVLEAAYEAQLEGRIQSLADALRWLRDSPCSRDLRVQEGINRLLARCSQANVPPPDPS